MNNYRCPQCGLLNWATADQCKRCRLPNTQNVPQQFEQQPAMPNTVIAATQHTAVQMPFASPPNYQTPPQFQYERAGSYSPNNAPHYSGNYQSPNTYNENHAEIEKAEKAVKSGYVAGIVWTVLLAIGTLAIGALSMALPDLAKSAPNPAEAAKTAAMVSKVMVGILLFLTVLVGGLTYGVRKKSMACAIILAVLSLLGLLNALSEQKLGAIMFGLAMFAFFAVAANGINTLKKHGQID
jgi:hypothetical protein